MSHTSYFKIDGIEYAVIHNGDWSGDAELRWQQPMPDGGPPRHVVVTLPGRLLTALSRRATLWDLVSVIENMMAEESVPLETEPPPTVTIDLNGRKMKAAVFISYWEIVKIAQPKRPDAILSVTYSRGPKDNREGTLSPGERVGVCEGMHFSAYDTSNA